MEEAWQTWWSLVRPLKARNLPILVCWAIWLVRNKLIFSNISPLWNLVSARLLSIYSLILDEDKPILQHTIIPEVIDKSIPWAYFDGSAQVMGCGGEPYYIYLTLTSSKSKWGWAMGQIILLN